MRKLSRRHKENIKKLKNSLFESRRGYCSFERNGNNEIC
jgi:hypothetical protein